MATINTRRAFTNEQARDIRKAANGNIAALARLMEVDTKTVRNITTGATYTNVR